MISNIDSASILPGYLVNQYSYNEVLGNDGNARLHWQAFFQSFTQMGNAEVQNRQNEISRLLKENGVTYNIYGDRNVVNRDWNVDAIPFIISNISADM